MKKIDCLLISPPIFYTQNNLWNEVGSNYPPLGLAAIAGYIQSKKFKTRIIDCNVDSPSIDMFEEYFKKNYVNQFDIPFIGITAMTSFIKKAYKIAQICKKYYPNAKIIFGGVHPTFMIEEVMQEQIIDYIIYGEGEYTLEELLSGEKNETINGLVHRKNGSVMKNPERKRIIDINSLPIPAYELLPIHKYKPAKGTYKKTPSMSMITSRGCPGKCSFCTKVFGNIITFKKADKIYEEIKFLQKNYGIKEIQFYDDTFTMNKSNVVKFCDLLIKNKEKLSWTCFARVDFIDQELLKLMKKSGCHQIMYGVESINQTVLKNINKKIELKQVENAVNWTKKAKIDCRLAFMIGNPGDTKKIIRENINFVKKINPDLLIVNITTPFPGTQMFDWAQKNNLILTYDWDNYDLSKPVMRLEKMSVKEIEESYKLMYKEFYFRPKYVFSRILKIRSLKDITILSDGFKSFIKFLIKS